MSLIVTINLIFISGQGCVPPNTPPLQITNTGGLTPDTIVNLPPSPNNFLDESLVIYYPSIVTSQIDPSGQFVGSPIQNYSVVSINGLPSGINYFCSNSNCGNNSSYSDTSQTLILAVPYQLPLENNLH